MTCQHFQYEILFCIQDLEDSVSYMFIKVRTDYHNPPTRFVMKGGKVLKLLFKTSSRVRFRKMRNIHRNIPEEDLLCLFMNLLFYLHWFSISVYIVQCRAIKHWVWNVPLQNMMEKYPEVEVKVFRGGENVGKPRSSSSSSSLVIHKLPILSLIRLCWSDSSLQALILKLTTCCQHTEPPATSWY